MRYFLIAYTIVTNSQRCTGNLYFSYGRFPSHGFIAQKAQEKAQSINIQCTLKDVVITNIFEFKCKEDYENFIAE